MRTIDASSLEYFLLGLLSQAPLSGYTLRKLLTQTPMRHYSDSPGAVYPALRRLARKKWIAAGAPPGIRRRQEYRILSAGRAALAAWLRRPVTRDDVIYRTKELILRFAFMGAVLPAQAVEHFLQEYRRETDAYSAVLRQYFEEQGAAMPWTGRLAFEQGMAQYRTNAEWAQNALIILKNHPKELEP